MRATFKSGILAKGKKEATENIAFEEMLANDKVYIPISQHIGAACTPIVKKGDKVKAGTLVAALNGFVSANIYSSISGEVEGFELREDVFGAKIQHIVIKNDGKYEEETLQPIDNPTPEQIIERVKEAGIVGMGGATFPSHVKLMPKNPIKYLIINGAECEPYITADYRLMLEKAEGIVEGIKILQKALSAEQVIVGIEDNKPLAIENMDKFCSKEGIKVLALKTKYPQGGEKQLIYALTRLEVPRAGLPSDVGCVVFNVATAFAVYEAVKLNRPSYARYMTVSGKGVKNAKNLYVRNGIPFEEIAQALGVNDYIKAISGGPMMGISLPNLRSVTIKGTSCLLLLTQKEIRQTIPSSCINCAQCHKVCPMNLMPMMIDCYMQAGNLDMAEKYDFNSCIECGSCAYTCPARIPLVQSIKLAKKLHKEKKQNG